MVYSPRWGAAAAVGAQRGATLARNMWPRWGAAWDCAGVRYGAAGARSMPQRQGAACVCVAEQHAAARGAQRGVALGRSPRLC